MAVSTHGVAKAQGWLYGRAVPLDELLRRLPEGLRPPPRAPQPIARKCPPARRGATCCLFAALMFLTAVRRRPGSSARHGKGGRMPGERGRQTRREDGKPYAGGPGRLTHAERVIDPASGLTKGDLARYYTQAAPLMRPYLKGRPVSLVRAPSGIGGPVFPAPHGCRDARRASVAGVPVSGASALAGAADAEGGAGGSPDECHRIPHLERREDDHRQAGPHRVRPGPGRGRALGERQAGGGCCARC